MKFQATRDARSLSGYGVGATMISREKTKFIFVAFTNPLRRGGKVGVRPIRQRREDE